MPVSGSSTVLRFDLYRDSTPPGAPGPSTYIGLWLHKLAAADGLAWTGLFDASLGDQAFSSLLFDDGSARSRIPAALTIDFDASGTQATVRNELSWGTVKNIALDQFSGSALRIEGFQDVFIDLDANAADQNVTVAKAQQGRVELGGGNDTLVIEAFTDRFGTGRTFFIETGAGNDSVTVTPFAGLGREAWITTNARLGAGNDRFTGMGSHDTVAGGDGDDIAELRGGTNFFDGGAGYDTLILRGLKASYRIDDLGQGRWRLWDNQAAVDGDDGITTFWNVEKVVFKDQDWLLAPATGYNNPPVAGNDGGYVITGVRHFTFAELLANDSDPDGNPLTVIAVGDAVGGTVLRSWQTGTVIFTPNAGYSGPASFTYQVGDGRGGVAQATVSLSIGSAANTPPDAVNDSATTAEDTAVTIAVLANDADADGNALAVTGVTNGANGTVAINANGTLTYTPNANFNGGDQFTYTVADGQGGTDTATVTVTVTPVNDAPVVVGESFTIQESNPLILAAPGVLANDSDPENDPISVTAFTQGANGAVFVGADGSLIYQPNLNFVGTDSFTYTVSDGSASSQGSVTITVVEGTPIAAPDVVSTRHDTPLLIPAATLLTNDSDPNGDALFIVGGNSTGTQGTVAILPGGNFQFTPAAGFAGTTSFTYTVTDGFNSAQATVTVNVTNEAPVVQGEQFTIQESNPLVVAAPGVLANDSDPDGDPLAVSQFTQGANGAVFVGADGQLIYQPNLGFVGADSFTYTVSDGVAGSVATVDVTVVEGTPIAANDAVIAFRDTPLLIQAASLLANDSDPNGDALFINGGNSTGTQGTVAILSGGNFQFTPAAGFVGTTSFAYSVTDGFNSAQATVSITVRPPNTVDAVDDSYSFSGSQLAVDAAQGILANDTDPDGDAFSLVAVDYSGTGQLYMANDGTFLYVPAAGFLGTDSFTYTIRDSLGAEDTATVQLTVRASNAAPVAAPDAFSVQEGRVLSMAAPGLLANDSDADGDAIIAANFGQGANGVVTMVTDGSFTYTPNAGFSGTDSFTYRIFDGTDYSADATVTITVVEGTPIARNDSYSVHWRDGLSIAAPGLLVNDSDPNGDPIIAANFSQGANGTVTMVTDGSFTYTPDAGFSGTDSFSYRIFDGIQYSADATVTITVVEGTPIAVSDSYSITAGQVLSIAAPGLLANDFDPNGDPIIAANFGQAAHGTVTMVTDGSFTYTPNAGFTGTDSFTYRIFDGVLFSTDATVTVTVLPANAPPVANPDAISIDENDGWSSYHFVNVLANDTDADGDPLSVTAVNTAGTPIIADLVGDTVRFFVNDSTNDTNGVFVITYTVSDGQDAASGAITITVTPQNDAPRDPQGNDAALGLLTAEDTPLVIGVAALLADDANPADEAQVALLFDLSNWVGGTIANNANGTLTFTPGADFNGQAGFYYRAQDDQGAVGDYVWVPVSVTAVNDPLTANDDIIARQFQGGGTQTITRAQLVGNDIDVDNDGIITSASIVSGITSLVLNPDQSVTVTYAAGAVPVFTYTLADGLNSDSATVTLNSGPQVTGTPQAWVIDEDIYSYPSDDFLIALAGVTDPNNDNLFIRSFGAAPNLSVFDYFGEQAQIVGLPDFNGATTLTFTISDGNAVTDLAVTLDVTVTPQPDTPRDTAAASNGLVGYDGAFAGTEETPVVISKAALLADDVDPDGGSLSWWTAYSYGYGAITDTGADIVFTPYANYAGELIGFYYYVQDSQGQFSDPIYVTVNLANTPDPITANDDVVLRTAGTSQVIAANAILGNDNDPDPGDSRTIVDLVANNGIDNVHLDGNGDVVVEYSPGPGSGRASFTYTVQDSTGNTDTATVALNRAPVATGDGTFTLDEGQNSVFIPYSALLGNDTDPDGDALYFSGWNWGYGGSNVYVSVGWFEGGEYGLRAYLSDTAYTGPAEFQYRAYDGHAYSNIVTVTLNSVAGNDAPVAEADYWYYNGAGYADQDPQTNPMVGYEDQPIIFPVSLLLDGQSYAGSGRFGADSDEEGDAISLVAGSLASPYGAVSVIDVGGVDHIRFTPNADVNSGDPWGGLDWSRISFSYAVTDGQAQSAITQAYLLVLPENDLPVANDDNFTVSGSGPYTLAIGQQGGLFDVRANDVVPDDYPYGQYTTTSIVDVQAVSGIGSLAWDGYSVTLTADGSGDPIVFEYVLQENDGDTATAQVSLTQRQALVYFSGSVPDSGRELWVYDPGSYDATLGSAFATMVDAAELYGGLPDSTPLEITALADSVFWRGIDGNWHLYRPDLGRYDLNSVGVGDFDAGLPDEQANLGVRAGDHFWAANYDQLVAYDAFAGTSAYVSLPGYDRNTLSDAGHDPAYAATIPTYDPVTGSFIDTEQLFVVLWNPGGAYYNTYQATGGADFRSDISEIAGLQVVEDPNNAGQYAKTLYFAGDYVDEFGIFHLDALWKVTLTDTGSGWSAPQGAELIDNGSGALIPSEARNLLVTEVALAGTPIERLFWFQKDANGDDQIATRYDDFFAGSAVSTGSTFAPGYVGQEMIAYTNGVAFSAYDAGNDESFVGSYIDSNFDGVFEVYGFTYSGVVEQLAADPASGRSAFVVDSGGYDTLYRATYFGTVEHVADVFGEITDVRYAGDQLVWIAPGANGSDTLFAFDYQAGTMLEVPTDEPSANSAGDGYTSGFGNVAIGGGLVFEADTGLGLGYRLFVTNGSDLYFPGNGIYRSSEGAELNGAWVGTGYRADTAELGLFSIDAVGNATTLYAASTNFSNEAEVLGQKVLFGTTTAAVNEVLVYDAALAGTMTLLANHLLGAASTVGGNIIFNALDFGNPLNSDADTSNNVWTLYAYDGTSATLLLDLPAGAGGGQHVYEWWRHQDFLGDDSRIFWKQANDTTGTELHTIDLTAADPASTLTIVDVRPGAADGANWGDAVFANGRLYWQASDDGSTNQMRLWTTTDGTDAQVVTGAGLSVGNPYQFPWLPQAIGDEVFFLANSSVSNTWGLFQVNDDGVTASLISPAASPYIYGLAAAGGDLYYFASDGAVTDQMYRLTPGATPAAAGAPVALTSFTQPGGFMSDIFQGGDGNLYFRRDEPATGSELWVLDSNEPTGARLVGDLNTQQAQGGYAPQQLTPVPDPLEQWLAGTFQPGGGAAAIFA